MWCKPPGKRVISHLLAIYYDRSRRYVIWSYIIIRKISGQLADANNLYYQNILASLLFETRSIWNTIHVFRKACKSV